MAALIAFICLALIVVVLIEIRERKRSKEPSSPSPQPRVEDDWSVCCGQHLVCERETLLNSSPEIVYYDDEELDSLAGISPEEYTTEQHQLINDIFLTLNEDDVTGWCRSLQLRNIQLPDDIREEALLIVRERRQR